MNKLYEPYWSNYLKQFDFPPSYFQDIPKNTNKFCVIVEPRIHSLLIPVIKNFMVLLKNKGWGLMIFHGNKNQSMLIEHLNEWKNVYYINLKIDDLDRNQYNYLFTTPELWNTIYQVGGRHALLFQTDCLLLKDNLDEYIKYDFIGAPWKKPMHNLKYGFNGGFSLRNVETMIRIVSNCLPVSYEDKDTEKITGIANEDIYFAYHISNNEGFFDIPSIEIAKSFSIETMYHDGPVGLHKPHLNIFPNNDNYINMLSKKHFN